MGKLNFCGACGDGTFVPWEEWAAHYAEKHPAECDRVCQCESRCAMGKGHAPGKKETSRYGAGEHRCSGWLNSGSCF